MESQITESKILADAFQSVRNLTKLYLSKFEGIDIFQNLEFNGKKFNSAYWLMGHLAWSEHYLLVEGLGGKKMDIPWLEKFSLGAKPDDTDRSPAYGEILKTLDKVHDSAMKQMLSLSGDELDKPNMIDATFGGKNTKRAVILHAIRHEPAHAGQLSWILKANGITFV